ncbi:MAG TPA: energy transducer TonB [Verrucomicrobiae bacterium]|nr:energy transducer TonB [Verrucomicrobiae bacterium]
MESRRKRNSSKVNLTISAVFHALVIAGLMYFAARQGMLGKKLKEITATIEPKEKKPEPPKEKRLEPKVEPVKPAELPKLAATAPPPRVDSSATPPPAAETAPAVAPAPVSIPAFEFGDGAKEVQSTSDPNTVYKSLVEHALRSHWNRPEDIDDSACVAEVEMRVDADGNVSESRWVKGSGNTRWDKSVKQAIVATPLISRPPPKGFPSGFIVRFDVESMRTEEVLNVSSR